MNQRLARYMNSPRITEARYWENHIDNVSLKYGRNVLLQSKEDQKKELAMLAREMHADQMQFMRVIKAYVNEHELDKEARRQARALTNLAKRTPSGGPSFGRL